MRIHRLLLQPVVLTLALSLALLTGCGKSKEETPTPGTPFPTASGPVLDESNPVPSGLPLLIISQTPEMARPGQFVQNPRGLVVAVWRDGRMIRCVDPSTVGKSYVTGTIDSKERDALLQYLESNDIKNAPKVPHLRLHTATLVSTLRLGNDKEKWTTELPDDKSVWPRLRTRLLGVPMSGSHPADATIVRSVSEQE
jgi:hypothetical protein